MATSTDEPPPEIKDIAEVFKAQLQQLRGKQISKPVHETLLSTFMTVARLPADIEQ